MIFKFASKLSFYQNKTTKTNLIFSVLNLKTSIKTNKTAAS